jgi:phosphate:Na+ symporter
MGSLVLLDLMGGVALLLWGLHMVHSGILRGFGPDLRRLLAKALKNRFTAFAAGIGLTALLQSSTAGGRFFGLASHSSRKHAAGNRLPAI